MPEWFLNSGIRLHGSFVVVLLLAGWVGPCAPWRHVENEPAASSTKTYSKRYNPTCHYVKTPGCDTLRQTPGG